MGTETQWNSKFNKVIKTNNNTFRYNMQTEEIIIKQLKKVHSEKGLEIFEKRQ